MAKFKRLTDADYALLQPYETQMRAIRNSNYYRGGIPQSDLRAIQEWKMRHSGVYVKKSLNCQDCLRELLDYAQRAYFMEKELREQEAAAAEQQSEPTTAKATTQSTRRKARVVKATKVTE